MIDDLDVSVSERLDAWMAEVTPKEQRRRFRSALRRAKRVLEQTTPILGAMTPRGLLLGIYSDTTLGRLTVVVASADDAIMFEPPLRAIGRAVADAESFIAAKGAGWAAARGALPAVIAAILEEQSLNSPGLASCSPRRSTEP